MKTRKEKEKILKDLVEKFSFAKGYLIVSLLNLDATKQKRIKDILKENQAIFQVTKKTLVYKANPEFPFKDEELKIPFAFIWNFDETLKGIQSLKFLFKEGIQIEVIKGCIDGKILSKDEVLEIINLPSKEELLTKTLQNLKSPLYKLNFSLTFSLRKLILILSQIKNKN